MLPVTEGKKCPFSNFRISATYHQKKSFVTEILVDRNCPNGKLQTGKNTGAGSKILSTSRLCRIESIF